MGTTLVMVLVHNNQIAVAHVGDSRLYGLTRQGLSQLTVDHEVGQREINRGVEPAIAYARPDAYQLTQALGPRSNQEIAPTITYLTVSQDTLLVLCSDGLSDNELLESHVESHLAPLMRTKVNLEDGVADLIDLANDHNGHDNITAIVVRMKLRPHLNAANETD
jgi:protein phosphatase